MGILVSPRFTGSSLRKVSGNWTARESWNVVGTPDKNSAIEAACPFDTPHGLNPNMKAGFRDADNHKGPWSWIVVADFSFGDHGKCAPTPLDEPARIMAEPGIEIAPADTDYFNHPLMNSAGDPFDGGLPKLTHTFSLSVRKCFPFYDVQKSIAYVGAVNSDPFFIKGAGGVDPRQCVCRQYKPAEEYTEFAPFVWIDLVFDFKPGPNPWDLHPVDMGRNGWYTSGGTTQKGVICFGTKNPTPIEQDVPLDGTGKPIDPTLMIMDSNFTAHAPVANPNIPSFLKIESQLSNNQQKTLLYYGRDGQPFAGLI